VGQAHHPRNLEDRLDGAEYGGTHPEGVARDVREVVGHVSVGRTSAPRIVEMEWVGFALLPPVRKW